MTFNHAERHGELQPRADSPTQGRELTFRKTLRESRDRRSPARVSCSRRSGSKWDSFPTRLRLRPIQIFLAGDSANLQRIAVDDGGAASMMARASASAAQRHPAEFPASFSKRSKPVLKSDAWSRRLLCSFPDVPPTAAVQPRPGLYGRQPTSTRRPAWDCFWLLEATGPQPVLCREETSTRRPGGFAHSFPRWNAVFFLLVLFLFGEKLADFRERGVVNCSLPWSNIIS